MKAKKKDHSIYREKHKSLQKADYTAAFGTSNQSYSISEVNTPIFPFQHKELQHFIVNVPDFKQEFQLHNIYTLTDFLNNLAFALLFIASLSHQYMIKTLVQNGNKVKLF